MEPWYSGDEQQKIGPPMTTHAFPGDATRPPAARHGGNSQVRLAARAVGQSALGGGRAALCTMRSGAGPGFALVGEGV